MANNRLSDRFQQIRNFQPVRHVVHVVHAARYRRHHGNGTRSVLRRT